MAPEKTTVMILKVDLSCSSCYKKVKKVLCKIPQIRDQRYNEDGNEVMVTVVCCSPEKIRDKLCYKGGGVIKSIAIIDPPKPPKGADGPPKPEKPKDAPKPDKPKDVPKPDKPKDAPKPDKPKDAPKPDKPKDAPKPDKPKDADKPEKPKDKPKGAEKPKDGPPASEMPMQAPPMPEPIPVPMKQPEPMSNVPAPGSVMMMPASYGFPPPMYCYEPSYDWYGTPVAPPLAPPLPSRPCYDNYPNWCRCGQPKVPYGCRCDYTYFSEENTNGCTIM